MQSFNLELELAQQDGTEFKVGKFSESQDLALIPLAERRKWLPQGIIQSNNIMDTSGCANRSPIAILKAKFTYLYHHDMLPELKKFLEGPHKIGGKNYSYVVGTGANAKVVFDETFVEILSDTTPQGNSMKAPLETIRKYGLIPECLPLEDNMTWEQYMDKKRITQEMLDLGYKFSGKENPDRLFTIVYEQVPESQFSKERKIDWLDVAANAWPKPVDGIYYSDVRYYNHAFPEFNDEIEALDSYPDYDPETGTLKGTNFIKRLDKNYKHFEWGYTLSIIKQQTPQIKERDSITQQVYEILKKNNLLEHFANWLALFAKTIKGVWTSKK